MTLRFEEVPGYSMRVVRVFEGPGPVPLATLSITDGKSIIASPGVPEDVIVQAALWLAVNPEPTR